MEVMHTCEYKILVKGNKLSCFALMGSIFSFSDKMFIKAEGGDEDFSIYFQGECLSNVDFSTVEDNNEPLFNKNLFSNNVWNASDFGRKYMGISLKSKSRIFNVEVFCTSSDIEEQRIISSVHYKNGEEFEIDYIEMPEILKMPLYEDTVEL